MYVFLLSGNSCMSECLEAGVCTDWNRSLDVSNSPSPGREFKVFVFNSPPPSGGSEE